MMKSVLNFFSKFSFLIMAGVVSLTSQAQSTPELVFKNPVLKSGTANKQGAIYRFSEVTPGVDAEVKLKTFSRPDLTMLDVDLAALGWDKALQPQFGLGGVVPPYQNWFVDFEVSFFKGGTTNRQKMQKVVLTALDVDGDGWSINEYANFVNPNTVAYSPSSALLGTGAILTLGSNGESTTSFTCKLDSISQIVIKCSACNNTGVKDGTECVACEGSGLVYKQCKHPYELENISQGTIQNYNNIDTAATQVMVTYTYLDKDRISFRYGAASGAYSSNGSGIRLNSVWGKQFDLAPWTMLPVNFSSFTVLYANGDVNINWQASNSEQLNHFVVQRSTDGKTYTNIAMVLADNTASYSYKDKSVSSASGVVYYRVVSIDRTKETQYTVVKLVRLAKSEAQTMALNTYPNPVASDLLVTLPNSWQGKAVALQLYTANGIMAKSLQLGNAAQTETMILNGLAKGLYVVKATCGDETAQQRIVKN
ncbi:MAG TPA: T9SS type A sorting domain-containing protein [Chitinophagaceae bacterium]|nr:T9SS type A sorting domain-containing protein [Chitinophagaceae bacterium]